MIFIPTIPHTGTHFMRDELLKEQATYCNHIWADAMTDWHRRLRARWPIVVPLRHPRAVAASWKRRGKDVFELPGWWSRLNSEIDRYDALYLPLDSPDRQDYLDKINLELGLNLITTWPVVREDRPAGKSATLNNREASSVEDTMWQLHAFFARFYPTSSFP